MTLTVCLAGNRLAGPVLAAGMKIVETVAVVTASAY